MMNRDWNNYFMELAELVSTRSRDKSVKVGCVIVNPITKAVLSTGYNDFPRGVNDEAEWRRKRTHKYMWTEHAERNAIYLAAANGTTLQGAHIYINQGGFPCSDCARGVIQTGMKVVYMYDDKWKGSNVLKESFEEAKIMLKEAGVEVIHLQRINNGS